MVYNKLKTDSSRTTILIRIMVGVVFLSEGIQKFLFADKLGAGRFEKIGLPSPDLLGPFVGSTEILCGLFILLGFLTRFAAIPLTIIMLVAIFTTKVEIFNESGFWAMLHESRTDLCMLIGSVFLIIKGGGKWSFDQKFGKQ